MPAVNLKLFLLGLPLLLLGLVNPIAGVAENNELHFYLSDSILNQYLSDTIHAGAGIRQLDTLASRLATDPQKKSQAIQTFQLGLMLVPYARDSFEAVSRLYADFSSLLNEAGAPYLAIDYVKKALASYKLAHAASTSTSYNLSGKLASFYLKNNELDSAGHYYQLAINEAQNTGMPTWIAGAQNNLGICLFKKRNYADAYRHFKMADSVLTLNHTEDSILKCSIVDNMAQLLLAQGNLGAAAVLYKANIASYTVLNIHQDIVKSRLGLGNVFLAQRNLGDLWTQLSLIATLVHSKKFVSQAHVLGYYELLLQYYLTTGNFKEALKAQEQLSSLKDSISNNNSKALKTLSDAMISSEMYKFNTQLELYQNRLLLRDRDLKSARGEAKSNLLFLIITFILGTGLCILLYVFYRNKSRIQRDQIRLQQSELKIQRDEIELEKIARQLSEAQFDIQRLEREKLTRELEYKKKDISELSLYLSGIKNMNLTMLNKLGDIKNKKPLEQKESINNLVAELGVITNSQEKTIMFQENIEKVNTEFTQKVIARFPELTKSEIELCSFFKMNLSNKDISLLKNISPLSVKMARYRLRKKLGLAPEGDIYQFLSNL